MDSVTTQKPAKSQYGNEAHSEQRDSAAESLVDCTTLSRHYFEIGPSVDKCPNGKHYLKIITI